MEELDAQAFRGYCRYMDGGRNPACDERVLSTHFSQLSFRQVDGSTRAHIGHWERSLLVRGPFFNLPFRL